MEYEESPDLSESELRELCYMALSELEEEEAANVVLTYLLGSRLNPGQIENLAQEVRVEKLWEDFADISFHEILFNAHQILYDACSGGFHRPEALRFECRVTVANYKDLMYFSEQTEAGLIRLLVQGMPSNTRIARLYEKELLKGPFEDAGNILWQLKKLDVQCTTIVFEGISSPYWFRDLRHIGDFSAEVIWESPPPDGQ
jgi:hypothetical protein